MKKSINVNSLKGVDFFLGGVEKVDSLEIGAKKMEEQLYLKMVFIVIMIMEKIT